jgi:4-diphosphocytidyl-2-C-methyl-D-erythritol kinase
MKRYANAKVNLALDVLGTLPNGYHDLDMIMAPVSLADELEIEPADKLEHSIYFENEKVEENNTLTKTLKLLEEQAGLKGFYEIHVKKNIPLQAGLAGGSADAACLIKALNEMENLHLSLEQMQKIGVQVGADVPYCLQNSWSRVQGIGEKVTPLDSDWKFKILLAKPKEGVSTKECFELCDEYREHPFDIDIVQDAVCNKNTDLLYQTMVNALEEPAMEILPQLWDLKEKMQEYDLVRVMMTGSGSALMGFSVDDSVLEYAYEQLKDEADFIEIVQVG